MVDVVVIPLGRVEVNGRHRCCDMVFSFTSWIISGWRHWVQRFNVCHSGIMECGGCGVGGFSGGCGSYAVASGGGKMGDIGVATRCSVLYV